MATGEITSRPVVNRRNGVLGNLHRTRRFAELHGMDRAGACMLRSSHYNEKSVVSISKKEAKKAPEEYMDAFDLYSRFFLLKGNFEFPPNYLILKTINRQIYGFLPSELSLYSKEELLEINRKGNLEIDKTKLSDSTMTRESKDRLTKLIDQFKGSQKIYEVGGLCGSDKSRIGILGLTYLIARIANIEEWDLEIQSCHPKHLGIYLASGLPYRTINDSKTLDKKTTAESYLDYLGRPAITLYLEGNELREKFPALEKRLFGRIE